jgi:C4-dicarboxylate-binding protein DctP
MLAGLALAAVLGLPAEAGLKLRVTLQLPISSHLGQNLLLFKDRVVAASDGEIEIEIYPSAQLFTDKEVPLAVASGQIEMGVASLARFAGTIPAVDIFNVPFLFNTEALVRAATAPGSPVRAPLDEAMVAKGARPLWWQPYGQAVLLMREVIVRRPGDLAGLKIRTFGKALEGFVNALDGAAVNISGSRQFLAYERGTVDGGTTGLIGVRERKLYQVLDTITLTNHTDIEFIVIINEALWQGLEPAQRTILTTAARIAEEDLRDRFPALEEEARDLAVDNGMEVITLSGDDIAAWRKATAPLAATYVEAAGPLGARLLDAARTLPATAGD